MCGWSELRIPVSKQRENQRLTEKTEEDVEKIEGVDPMAAVLHKN
jgi:hypothetical protein